MTEHDHYSAAMEATPMSTWTLHMTCPLDGQPLGYVNQVRHEEPRTGVCRTLITVVACPDGHQWEAEINLSRHATTQRRTLA